MKKILFLSPAYPYGHTGPSNNCTLRVMEALVQTRRYEVYCVSYRPPLDDTKPNYRILDGVHLLPLKYPEGLKKRTRTVQRIRAFIRIPIYPITSLFSIWKFYCACRSIVMNEHFDLLISQFNPFESVISGALLKKNGFVDKHIVLSWDVIYGKVHNPIIPKHFAISRQRKLVSWIARYTDKLVTIFSQKSYHERYGDVPEAREKRCYLGIPSIARPNAPIKPLNTSFIKEGSINVIYAGSIYSENDLEYAFKLLNATSFAEQLNFILLCKDPTMPLLQRMAANFKGSIHVSGWVSSKELYALYSQVDLFLAFSGKWAWGVPGKTYEYMSFGKPIVHFYEYDDDANLTLFAPYPLFKGIDIKKSIGFNKIVLEEFIGASLGSSVSFSDVERLFPYMTLSAYINIVDGIFTHNNAGLWSTPIIDNAKSD